LLKASSSSFSSSSFFDVALMLAVVVHGLKLPVGFNSLQQALDDAAVTVVEVLLLVLILDV